MSDPKQEPRIRTDVREKVPSEELERDRQARGTASEEDVKQDSAERAAGAAISGIDMPSRRDE